MATRIDKEACREAYNLVRDDNTDINWAAFKYDGSMIVPGGQGTEYEEFKQLCKDDERLFGFVRITTGDAMSKRAKFTLITWIGENNFAKEFMVSDIRELEEDYIREELKKAGGANYDAQTE
ncbi:hypothetical protein JZ751_021061 [Albula glossodonta]|uniref:Coactosin-like protein n=1 Tax=Albula glossodonta TaxID=121402 RepID=A0A8T2PNX7_9TELE|nr:hypothetical protein JZ751_021061 [Albula glossodonta]